MQAKVRANVTTTGTGTGTGTGTPTRRPVRKSPRKSPRESPRESLRDSPRDSLRSRDSIRALFVPMPPTRDQYQSAPPGPAWGAVSTPAGVLQLEAAVAVGVPGAGASVPHADAYARASNEVANFQQTKTQTHWQRKYSVDRDVATHDQGLPLAMAPPNFKAPSPRRPLPSELVPFMFDRFESTVVPYPTAYGLPIATPALLKLTYTYTLTNRYPTPPIAALFATIAIATRTPSYYLSILNSKIPYYRLPQCP